jgi:GDP-4-dehydro-6-deoxy-D-mannose reductase
MRNLVTGVTGFAGGHLAEALLASGAQVVGLARRRDWPPEWAHLAGRVVLRPCDLVSDNDLVEVLREASPERIYHLAGYSHAGRSFAEPEAAWQGNLTATRRLFDAVVAWGGRARVLYVSSGMVYGDALPGELLHEERPLRPVNPYAAAKAAADLLAYQMSCHPGLDVVRARPFNHVGPRQSMAFAVANFARQVAAIERGDLPPVLEVGNLRPRRDLTDVRDTVAAYVALLDQGRSGEAYNVATGAGVSMQEVLDRLLALSGLRVVVRTRTDLLRAGDRDLAQVDTTKVRRETGWQPRFDLGRTLADTLDYWRSGAGVERAA